MAAAIKGHGGMPSRGGMADLTDAELKSAMQFMFSRSTGAEGRDDSSRGCGRRIRPPAKPDGAKVYAMGCNACHAAGVAGAPKFGDKAAWAARSKAGVDALVASVIKGKGAMPPKGAVGQAPADADLRAAVEYMLARCEVGRARHRQSARRALRRPFAFGNCSVRAVRD